MDNITKEQRSYVMSRIRSKDTGPERRMSMVLVRNRVRFKRWSPLPGKPDFVLERQKVAIFVDGCFFHGCRYHGSRPRTNAEFWRDKIRNNRKRDKRADRALQERGYAVWRFWEHEVRKNGSARRVLEHLDMLNMAIGPSRAIISPKRENRRQNEAI